MVSLDTDMHSTAGAVERENEKTKVHWHTFMCGCRRGFITWQVYRGK